MIKSQVTSIEDLIQFFRSELAERRDYSASKCFEIAIEKSLELLDLTNEEFVRLQNAEKYLEFQVQEYKEMISELHNKIMVQWEKDFGSIHNEQSMDAYTVYGFINSILKK